MRLLTVIGSVSEKTIARVFTHVVTALALLLGSVQVHAQVSLTLGDVTVEAGNSDIVAASISTDGTAVALQFDVLYDPALVSVGTVNGGSALTLNHSIASNPISPGRDRVVITSTPVTALAAGTLAEINFTVDSAAAGITTLSWDAVVIGDVAANPIAPAGLTDGTITITVPPPTGSPPNSIPIPASPLWSLALLALLMTLVVRRLGLPVPVTARSSLLVLCLLSVASPIYAQGPIPGDANNDGIINGEDVRLIVESILERGVLPGDGDCNEDDTVNVLDTICSQLEFIPGETTPIILGPGDRSIAAGVPFEMVLFAADPDANAALTWALLSGPGGLAVGAGGVLSWTPGAGDVGDNPVSVRVTDETGRDAEATFTITVFTVPEAPSSNGPPVLNVPADQGVTVGSSLAVSVSATDPDAGDRVTFTLINGPAGLTLNSSSGAIDWRPQANQAGPADVVVQATDPAGNSDFGSFIITALEPNGPPVAVDEVFEARLGVPLMINPPGVLANDSDPNGDALSALLVNDATHGDLTLNIDGSFAYLLEPTDTTTPVELELLCDNSSDPGAFGSASAIDSGYQGNETLAVGDVDNDGNLEIVGKAFLTGETFLPEIWIMSAADCSEKFQTNATVELAGGFDQYGHLGLLDIDGDGDLEIIGPRSRYPFVGDSAAFDDEHLIAIHHDGTLAWPGDGGSATSTIFDENVSHNGYGAQGPTFADLDADGNVEIIMASSIGSRQFTYSFVVVYNAADGSIKWEYLSDVAESSENAPRMPYVVDLDMDGTMEVVIHNSVLDHEGNLEFVLPSLVNDSGNQREGHLKLGIGNFDDDAFPELVGMDNFFIYRFEHDGTKTWEIPYRSASDAQITVADFDGDGELEFATPNCMSYSFNCNEYALQVFNGDGSLLWDHSGQAEFLLDFGTVKANNITAFDANRDGAFDLVFRNDRQQMLYVYDGRDGTVLASVPARSTQAAEQRFTTVADVNGDGHAELITSTTGGLIGQTEIWTGTMANPLPAAPPYRNQWSFQEAYVNDDLSIPSAPVPHWLRPGYNGWNRITPEPDPLVGADDTFTYRASDGALSSNIATVTLDILPAGNPPRFLTEPVERATRGAPYAYAPIVYDPDLGDVVSFRLLAGPDGMTIDPATGELDWPGATLGTHPISVMVTDSIGFSSNQAWDLVVGEPVTVPDVIGASESAAETTLSGANLAKGRVSLTPDPIAVAGTVITQNPPAGAVAGFGAFVALTLSSGPGPLDRDSDNDGYSENQGDCNDGNNGIYPGAPDANGDGIDQDCDGIDGNKTLVAIEITPATKRILAGQAVPLAAMGIFEDGTAQNLTGIAAWSNGPSFSSGSAGNFAAQASFSGITGTANFTVVAGVVDDVAPVARIDGPAAGDEVTAPTDVEGTVSDNNLLRWELAYQYAGEENFVLFAEGETPVSAAPIDAFDPTTLLNGLYTIRLRVYDRGGNMSEDLTTVQVEGQLKVGNYDLQFADLDLPVAGLPIRVVRSYSTTDKTGKDFGVGWRLGLDTLRLGRNRPIGTAWEVIHSGLSYTLLETDIHTVAITLPDGRVESFDARVSPQISPVVPFPALSQTVSFVPRPGTYGSLEALGDNTVTIPDAQPGPARLTVGITADIYDPQRYRYTAVNGTQVVIHRDDGVESITDRNGNSLTISAGGISHSSGRSIAFTRDSAGRISAITDPDGNLHSYSYSAVGDLIAHTDPRGNTSRFEYDAAHNLIRIIDAAGRDVLRNVYDGSGRVVSSTDSEGRELRVVHDIAGQEERITDDDGALTRFTYDDRGNVVSKTDALGNTTIYAYDANDNLIRETNALGETETRVFDGDGNLLSVTDPLGNTTAFTVDTFGNVLTETDAQGAVTKFTYDADGNMARVEAADGSLRIYAHSANGDVVGFTDETGSTIGFEYNANGDQTARVDGRGNRVESQFDLSGRLVGEVDRRGSATSIGVNTLGARTEATDPLGNTERYTYGVTGRLESVRDALGNEQRQITNGLGQVLSVTDREGGELRFDFDLRGNMTSLRPPRGGAMVSTYDAAGRRTRIEFPDSSEVLFAYDAADRQVSRTDRRGGVTTFEYDAAGRLTATIDPLGQRTTQSYDANGNVMTETDALGNVTRHAYDSLNRRTLTALPDGRQFTFTYTARGELATKTDPLNNTTSYTYDANGNLTRVVDARGAETRYVYDAEDNLIEQIDGNGHSTRYEYDLDNRETRRIYPDGSAEVTEYDAIGRVSARVRADGTRISFARDAEGRVTRRSIPGGAAAYTWDLSGSLLSAFNAENEISYQRDIEGRITAMVLGDGRRVDYVRDAAGNVLEQSVVALPGGAPIVTRHSYDALDRVISTTDPDGGVTTYSYTPVGTPAQTNYANGVVTTFTYDATRRTTRIRVAHGATVLEEFNYSYDAADNITAVTLLDGSRVDYTYDELRRLLQETHRDGGGVVTTDLVYAYDAVGNRTVVTGLGGVETYRYDSADKLVTRGSQRFSYDANGNLLSQNGPMGAQSYSYDALDRLQAVDGPAGTVGYRYDALDQRVGRDLGTDRVDYFVEPAAANATGLSHVLAETDADAGTLRATNVFDIRLLARATGGSRFFLHRDVSENVRFLTGVTGTVSDSYSYDAFGAYRASVGSTDNPYRFAGERFDAAAGLLHLRARDYQPSIGRFMGRDSFAGNLDDPRSRHRYLYAGNNPLSFADGSGRFTVASLMTAQTLSNIIVQITPTITTGITTIILLNKFWKAGFNYREAGYLMMVGSQAQLDLLPGRFNLTVAELGFAVFSAGNRFIEVGAFAINAAKKLADAGFAIVSAAKAVGGAATFVAGGGGTSIQSAGKAFSLTTGLLGLADQSQSAGNSVQALAKAVRGKSQGPDKETLKSKGELEAARNKSISKTLKKLAIDVFFETQ